MIKIKPETLKHVSLRLNAQKKLFSDPEFLEKIPLLKRPLMKLERKNLNNLIKEIDDLLEKDGKD